MPMRWERHAHPVWAVRPYGFHNMPAAGWNAVLANVHSLFVEQMAECNKGVVEKHSGTAPTHNLAYQFALFPSVAVDGAMLAGRVVLTERTMRQSGLGIF